jgi:hypothetical protein
MISMVYTMPCETVRFARRNERFVSTVFRPIAGRSEMAWPAARPRGIARRALGEKVAQKRT